MRSYSDSVNRYGVKHTSRQERKWKRGRGVARILEARFGSEEEAPTSDEIKFYIDSRSKPGPNENKKEKERKDGNRNSRKDKRNTRRRKEAERQKTAKKDRWRRRKEAKARQG